MIKEKLERLKKLDEDRGLHPSFNPGCENALEEFKKIGIDTVPSQILEMYEFTNGAKGITLDNLLTIEEIGKLIQDENSYYGQCLDGIDELSEFYKYCPFQETGFGGYYVFKRNSTDETIYDIDIDGENEIIAEFDTLEDFLDWQIEMREDLIVY